MAANDMIQGQVVFHDDFTGPFSAATSGLIASKHIYVSASGGTCTRLLINGGAARMLNAADESEAVAIFGPGAFEPDEAGLIVGQWRLRITDVSVASVFVGFSDADTDSVVIEDEDGTLAAVASDLFGVLLEGEQDTAWHLVTTQNGGTATQAAIAAGAGIPDLADNEWTTIRIEADAANSGRFRVFIDGVLATTATTGTGGFLTSALRSSITFYPAVSQDNRNSAYNVDVAEVYVTGGVGSVFD
jgi:hypothetical protein